MKSKAKWMSGLAPMLQRHWIMGLGLLLLGLAYTAPNSAWVASAASALEPAMPQVAGDLDPTFDNDGVVIQQPGQGPSGDSAANAVLVKSDGTILVAQNVTPTLSTTVRPSLLVYNANGVLQNPGQSFFNESHFYRDMALDKNGNVVIVGSLDNQQQGQQNDFLILRLNSSANYTPLPEAHSLGIFNGSNDFANTVVMEPTTGEAIVAGYSNFNNHDSAVWVRIKTDGTLDTSIGNNGRVVTDLGFTTRILAAAFQADGKLLAAGYANNGSGNNVLLLRYNANGTPDPSFGNNGVRFNPLSNIDARVVDIIPMPGSRFFALSTVRQNNSLYRIVVTLFDTTGVPDPSFGQNGSVSSNLQKNVFAVRLLQQSDGKLVVVGNYEGNKRDLVLLCFQSNGQPDSQFGTNGVVTTDLASFGGLDDVALDAVLQSDGKILVAGSTDPDPLQPFNPSKVALARYQTDTGAPVTVTPSPATPTPTATVVTPTPTNTPGGTIPPTTPTATPTLPPSDGATTAQPSQPVTLTIPTTGGGSLNVEVPAGAVDKATTLLYDAQTSPSVPTAGSFKFAGRSFKLTAYQNNSAINGFAFLQPVTIVIQYTDAEVAGLDENTLELFFYNPGAGQWAQTGISLISRDPANNRITFQISHLTEFALGSVNRLYLSALYR